MKSILAKQIKTFTISFFIILLLPRIALADIALFIHGYHSSGNAWRYNGITQILANSASNEGWNDAGAYTLQGNIFYPLPMLNNQPLSASGNHLLTAELPSETPIEVQAGLLSQYLNDINKRFPQQKIHLIAHSAGGLVARLSLVNDYAKHKKDKQGFYKQVVQLITIASPHMGSPIADMAEKASSSPLSFIAPFIGADEINRAEQLYKQLGQEDKNYFLFWLNRQPHPPMRYTSIIRANGSILKGDWLVPPPSQNMAYVPAIGVKAKYILTSGSHSLKFSDGFLLKKLLP